MRVAKSHTIMLHVESEERQEISALMDQDDSMWVTLVPSIPRVRVAVEPSWPGGESSASKRIGDVYRDGWRDRREQESAPSY